MFKDHVKMNFAEEEPRKVPKPVPFSESSLHPTVPEVSLILQETHYPPTIQSNNSFSGTEFQTYNAWRWKNLNDREKENLQITKPITKKRNEFHPINDKFSGSSIEKRKNEILYGNMDEPRRPLPPRQIPLIPKCVGASFSDASFSNEQWTTDEIRDENFLKEKRNYGNNNNINNLKTNNQNSQSDFSELNDIRDFYNIIAQQNTHMVQLQKQIEQLLKSQDVKEKQIKQLLKVQEAKETKIEQLLKMQDVKENHIEQLLKAQEKQEKQIEQLILSQEKKDKQMHEISKQFKKEFTTIGVMTEISVADKTTNTDLQCFCTKGCNNKGIFDGNKHLVDESSTSAVRFGSGDQSFTLHSLNLPTIQEHAPTPQSSIHVDIPEYNGSSDDESDSSVSENKETLIHFMSDLKPSGYTFYNNVLTQVNDIIQSQDDKENEETNLKKNAGDFDKSKGNKYMCLKEHNGELAKPVNGEKCCVDKLWEVTDFQQGSELATNSLKGINFAKENQSPSDISLRMNALALKYLKREQISQYEMQSQLLRTSKQPDVTIYNVTNLSFGTMRYLERHKLSMGENCLPKERACSPHPFIQQKTKATSLNSKLSNFHQ